jgi:hypothetical protein
MEVGHPSSGDSSHPSLPAYQPLLSSPQLARKCQWSMDGLQEEEPCGWASGYYLRKELEEVVRPSGECNIQYQYRRV